MFYYGVDPNVKRQSLIVSENAADLIKEYITYAEAAIKERSYSFKMSDYMLFVETGNREVFEREYFQRRKNCYHIFIAYWLTEEEKYLKPLIDYINYICDEYSWCLPAHMGMKKTYQIEAVETVDLFQAETARLFSEIIMCVGAHLPQYTIERMHKEIRRRVFASFEKGVKYRWETVEHNWTTVCGAGCTIAALYFGTDAEKQMYVSRFQNCLDSYLKGINDDGCCKEGMGYWNFGFLSFVVLAEIIRTYTDGKINYFNNPKVKALALYPQKIMLPNGLVPAFSDGDAHFSVHAGLISFLKSLYGEVVLPEFKYLSHAINIGSVTDLLWFDEDYHPDERNQAVDYFEQTQWYINRKKNYSFAAKGGYNDEPHNHNDIGTFLIVVGDREFLTDPGSGEYTKDTFLPEKRYTLVQNASRGHSVPIINGEYQVAGNEYRAKNVKATEETFELDIEGGYPAGSAKRVHRQFWLGEEKVKFREHFEFVSRDNTVIERFVTKNKAVIEYDGCVDCVFGKIMYHPEKYKAAISTESYREKEKERMITLYMIDFTLINRDESVFEFELIPGM